MIAGRPSEKTTAGGDRSIQDHSHKTRAIPAFALCPIREARRKSAAQTPASLQCPIVNRHRTHAGAVHLMLGAETHELQRAVKILCRQVPIAGADQRRCALRKRLPSRGRQHCAAIRREQGQKRHQRCRGHDSCDQHSFTSRPSHGFPRGLLNLLNSTKSKLVERIVRGQCYRRTGCENRCFGGQLNQSRYFTNTTSFWASL